MRVRDVLKRINGIDTPLGGISWEPPSTEVATARAVLTYLEDRRVLYNPTELEVPSHCVESVIEIRERLTVALHDSNPNGELAKNLRAMRAACRKFFDDLDGDHDYDRDFRYWPRNFDSWVFLSALGELRGVFGIHVAQIAAKFGLNVEDQLARILPAEPE